MCKQNFKKSTETCYVLQCRVSPKEAHRRWLQGYSQVTTCNGYHCGSFAPQCSLKTRFVTINNNKKETFYQSL